MRGELVTPAGATQAVKGNVTQVAYRLESRGGGTRFTYEHTGFTGVSGLFMARLLGRVRTKMLSVGLPSVLDGLPEDGTPAGG